jgi:metal-responsive CopG/Arc/MetJ family transcriptional regulator
MNSHMQVNKARLTISIDPDLYDRVAALGKGRRGGRSGVIEDCLRKSLALLENPHSRRALVDGHVNSLFRHTDSVHRDFYLEVIDQVTKVDAEGYEAFMADNPELRSHYE